MAWRQQKFLYSSSSSSSSSSSNYGTFPEKAHIMFFLGGVAALGLFGAAYRFYSSNLSESNLRKRLIANATDVTNTSTNTSNNNNNTNDDYNGDSNCNNSNDINDSNHKIINSVNVSTERSSVETRNLNENGCSIDNAGNPSSSLSFTSPSSSPDRAVPASKNAEKLQAEKILENVRAYEQRLAQREQQRLLKVNIDYDHLEYPFDLQGDDDAIITENDVIKGATIYKLIEIITEESGKGATQYAAPFLLTYRSLLTPMRLLQLLIKRYSVPERSDLGSEKELEMYNEYRKHIRLRVWYILKYWTENYFFDFQDDPELIAKYSTFVKDTLHKYNSKLSKQLEDIIDRKKTLSREVNGLVSPPPILPITFSGPDGSLGLLDIDPLELARQLTLIEYELYDQIQPKECLDQCWNKEDKEKRAPHVVKLIEQFNKSSRWVVWCVVTRIDITSRAKVIEHFIRISQECKKLNNFNSMMEIVSGLLGSSVSRLKRTWKMVPEELSGNFETEYSQLFYRNCKLLRDAVKHSVPPCLPYIGTYLADLTFIEDGNPNLIGDGKLINFEKRQMISKVISELRVYQQKKYSLITVPTIRDFLYTQLSAEKVEAEKILYELSLRCEPRESTKTM